jgi:polyisoprenyl-phosphate glycosyltransferase
MKKFIILIPVYNDWESLFKLLNKIDSEIIEWDVSASILIINDASTANKPETEIVFKNIKSVRIVTMKKNKGHARCNAAGLKFLSEKEDFDYVILMDGDGEDRPEELNLLFNQSKKNPLKTVVAERISRSEGFFFKALYECHKILTYVFTGKLIKFGNYSCLPKKDVMRLAKEASIWSSFSGSVTKTILERVSVPSIRGQRYFGPSQMNLFNLFIHSFSIIAVFKKVVIARSFLFLVIYLFFVSSNLTAITIFPVLIVIIFLFLILKISSRENIQELNSSLENISRIDALSNFNDR